jgi:putative Ca2+/H+ antiporter (TMEM165/GDT1 family)
MFFLLIVTYVTVFTGELVGDKLLYTISALSTRYRMSPLLSGVALAFMGKMAAAVVLGGVVARLPVKFVALISAATFFTMALALTLKAPAAKGMEQANPGRWFRPALISFSVVFFSEWGDVGQIAAATIEARFQAPLVVWLGATLAMVTKAILAMTIGVALRNRISQEVLRYCGVGLLFSLGLFSLLNVALHW